ncbi:MAG: hypothetical protein JKY82_06015 [Rhizobiaceae bacterium]|nr:hypothetical protein [Rhizobiaceae bacterium]
MTPKKQDGLGISVFAIPPLGLLFSSGIKRDMRRHVVLFVMQQSVETALSWLPLIITNCLPVSECISRSLHTHILPFPNV